jgi:phenylalanyl-tRNA synthetase beta chain
VKFTPERYASFIELQDKLHQNLCRQRTLVAIGTHDLATLSPPFRYRALPPKEIKFQPLSQGKEWVADELMEFYETDPTVKHLKAYPSIIKDSPVYPVIMDCKDVVLSLPPIINGEHSKIRLTTEDVFVECTAVDLTKAHIVLNTVLTMFSEYASTPFTSERVKVVYEDPAQCPSAPYVTPALDVYSMRASVAEINSTASISIDAPTAAVLASRMGLDAEVVGEDAILCRVPPTRSDVLHECDIVEDVAIAYGFNNIVPRIPATRTCAAPLPMNLLADKLRTELAHMGWWEALTTSLISRFECFDAMRIPDDDSAVSLSNPKTVSYQVVRKSLVPGLLKCVASNRSLAAAQGQRFFEVSDVVLLDNSEDTGARNERHLATVYAGPTAGFEIVQGVLERIMSLLEVPRRWGSAESALVAGAVEVGADAATVDAVLNAWGRGDLAYKVVPQDHSSFFPARGAQVILLRNVAEGAASHVEEIPVGSFGILHPDVLAAFEVKHACSSLELNLEPFLAQ